MRDAINASTFRYFVTGTAVATDTIAVHFVTGTWSYAAAPPASTSPTDLGSLVGQTTITVTLPVIAGYTIDLASLTDVDPEFVLTGTGLGTATINASATTIDQTTGVATYVLDGGTSFAAPAPCRSRWSRAAGRTSRPRRPATAVSTLAGGFVDVTFPAGPSGAPVDPASITGNEVTFVVNNGHTLTATGTPTATGTRWSSASP